MCEPKWSRGEEGAGGRQMKSEMVKKCVQRVEESLKKVKGKVVRRHVV